MALTWLAVTKVTVNVCPHPRAPPGRGPQPRTVDDRRTAVAESDASAPALTKSLSLDNLPSRLHSWVSAQMEVHFAWTVAT